ncbi:BtpA/SgcQ family protein [Salinilacihabitans rarus]|uniref:BtpA/SgcQ family protein n=1 Tax=Salinilacihabitans rarus TaxID=2961596 RepID=UPI0020C8DD31|nr:BtpA/SgcQ family protein [Salinilacihabitans rarus]
MEFEATFDTPKPILGMVHLGPLPGSPGYDGDLDAVVELAVADARALAAGGVDGIVIENFGDAPFHPDDVPKHTVASMTRAAAAVADATALPRGINVLRNDAAAAVSVAAAVGAAFVRVNVHTGARVTDQGVVEGRAHETIRLRERLDADVAVFADVDVKHSEPLAAASDPAAAFVDGVERGLADAAIVSGRGTGEPTDVDAVCDLVEARERAGLDAPILVGSGVREGTVEDLLSVADGAIVGTALKEGGETTAPVDEERVAALVARADAVR